MRFYFFSVIPLLFLFSLNLQYFKLQNPSTETSFVWGVTHQLKKNQRIDDLQHSERSLWALNKKTQVGLCTFLRLYYPVPGLIWNCGKEPWLFGLFGGLYYSLEIMYI